MEQMLAANIALDSFGIILSLIPIVYLVSGGRYKEKLNRFFLGVCISNLFMIVGDLADWVLHSPSPGFQQNLLAALSALFYVSSAFVLYFFALYITEYIKPSEQAQRLCRRAVTAVCGVHVFFAVLSPFTGAFFYVTDNGYQRGSLFLISQLVPLFCYLLFTLLLILYHGKLKRRELIFFLLYIFVPLGCGAAQMFLRGIAVVNIGVALALLFILVNIQFEHELALKRQEKALAEQRIDIMLSQIKPHFLYNALGTIACLCRTDPEKAEWATEEFAMFLRANMDSLKNREPIPFEKELAHVKHYLYLEKQRFQERLQVNYDIRATDFYVPPLSLQPLVENAVRHGILQKKEGGTVTIRTFETKEDAFVVVMDDGIGMEQAAGLPDLGDHAHIGLENVRERLESMVEGEMKMESSGAGTVVTLRIPLVGGF